MGNLCVFVMISTDGYFEGPDHELDWHTVDAEFNDFAIKQLNNASMLIFGRRTYELMAGFWPTDGVKQDDPVVAGKMNDLAKVVVTTSLQTAAWEHTNIIATDVTKQLGELKQQNEQDLLILGSSILCVSLLASGLIDEVRLMVNPVMLGKGNPVFAGLKAPLKLTLNSSRVFNSGNVLLCYKPSYGQN